VPFGMMKLKKKEFEDLKQGLISVNEYVTQFIQLSRYDPDDMDIDEKKQDWFLNGLNDVSLMLSKLATSPTFKTWWTKH
jgi:hypothetical protein